MPYRGGKRHFPLDFPAPFDAYLHAVPPVAFFCRTFKCRAFKFLCYFLCHEEVRHVRFQLTRRAMVHGMHRSVRFLAGEPSFKKTAQPGLFISFRFTVPFVDPLRGLPFGYFIHNITNPSLTNACVPGMRRFLS